MAREALTANKRVETNRRPASSVMSAGRSRVRRPLLLFCRRRSFTSIVRLHVIFYVTEVDHNGITRENTAEDVRFP